MKQNKQQVRIGELAEQLEVERFVIRFWEKEFNFQATRSNGGQRYYEPKDVEKFKLIKQLLYEEGFTIAGAKKLLMEQRAHKIRPARSSQKQKIVVPARSTSALPENLLRALQQLKNQLQNLRSSL